MTPSPEDAQDSHGAVPASGTSDRRAFLADGAALGASAILTALVGLLGWLLAARLLTPPEVGRASAFVNGFVFVAGLAELGLGQASLKWLPGAGEHAPRLVTRVYAGVVASALVLGIVWGLITRNDLADQTGLGVAATLGLYVLACLAWSTFHVQDFILTGLGLARWVPVENLSFGFLRIVLLVGLAKAFGALGVILSWVVPTLAAAVVVSAVLALRRGRCAGVPGVVPSRAKVTRLTGSTYASTIGITFMINLVPLVVTARFGPSIGAVFFIVWNGVAAVELAAAGFGSALVVRLRGDSMFLLRAALRQVLPLFVVPLLIAALAAEPLLLLFGKDYADAGTTMLRLVCLGLALRLVSVLVVAIHLTATRTVRLVLINLGTAVAMIATAGLLDTNGSLTFLGLGYVVIQVVVVVVALLDLRGCAQRERAQASAVTA